MQVPLCLPESKELVNFSCQVACQRVLILLFVFISFQKLNTYLRGLNQFELLPSLLIIFMTKDIDNNKERIEQADSSISESCAV